MKEYLLLLSISPVQSFIEASRKTVDLFNGSQILSDLIDGVNKNSDFINKDLIIFPEQSLSSKPNRLLAIVQTDNPMEYGIQLKNYITETLLIGKANKTLGEQLTEDSIKQFKDHFQINWNLLEYSKENYHELFWTIEREHSAMKMQREVSYFSETGRKCALDGKYNVKFYRKTETENDERKLYNNKLFQEKDSVEIFAYENSSKKLQPGEGLSAVSYYKRMYNNEHFSSTAGIALMEQINNTNVGTLCKINNYFKKFDESIENHQLLYEENLTEEYFRKNGYSNFLEKLSSLQNERKDLEKCIKENTGFKQLHKYYAMILFDGDSMGAFLSGETLEEKPEGEEFQEFHKYVSQCLGEFASYAKNYLDSENRGRTVYAGGEDFLGFINLVHLFEVMRNLRIKFKLMVFQKIKKIYSLKKELTFSAGIVIAHYKIPLSVVLGQVRKAEKRAKSVDGKNAFAISVLKHSGERQEAVWKWGEKKNVLKPIQKIYKHFYDKQFSSNFVKVLSREFSLLYEKNGKYFNQEHVRAELKRLLKRAYLGNRENKEKKEKNIEEMYSFLNMLLSTRTSSLKHYLITLNIIDFMIRKIS